MLEPLFILVGWQQTPKASLMLSHLNLVKLLVEVGELSCAYLALDFLGAKSRVAHPRRCHVCIPIDSAWFLALAVKRSPFFQAPAFLG